MAGSETERTNAASLNRAGLIAPTPRREIDRVRAKYEATYGKPVNPLRAAEYVGWSAADFPQQAVEALTGLSRGVGNTRPDPPQAPWTPLVREHKDAAAAAAGMGPGAQFIGDVLAPGPGELIAPLHAAVTAGKLKGLAAAPSLLALLGRRELPERFKIGRLHTPDLAVELKPVRSIPPVVSANPLVKRELRHESPIDDWVRDKEGDISPTQPTILKLPVGKEGVSLRELLDSMSMITDVRLATKKFPGVISRESEKDLVNAANVSPALLDSMRKGEYSTLQSSPMVMPHTAVGMRWGGRAPALPFRSGVDSLGSFFLGHTANQAQGRPGSSINLLAGGSDPAGTLFHESGHGVIGVRGPSLTLDFMSNQARLLPAERAAVVEEIQKMTEYFSRHSTPEAKAYGQKETESAANAVAAALSSPLYVKQHAPRFYELFKNWVNSDPKIPFEMLSAVAPFLALAGAMKMQSDSKPTVDEQVLGARRE